MNQPKHFYFCRICDHGVDLKTCKTDEHGMAVHEECYVGRVSLTSDSIRLVTRKPVHHVPHVIVFDISTARSLRRLPR